MVRGIDAHDGSSSFGVIGVFVHGEDSKTEREARAAEFFDPNSNSNVADSDDGAEVFDGIGADEVILIGIFLGIENAAPTEVFPERANGAFEKEQVACVVEDLKSVEVVEIDAHPGFVKTGHGGRI